MPNNVLEVCYRVIGKDIRSFKPHNDRSIEILQTWSSGGYFLVKDKLFPIEPASVFLINAIETHCSQPANANSYIRSKIIVSYDYMRSLMALHNLSGFIDGEGFVNGGCNYDIKPHNPVSLIVDQLFHEAAIEFNHSENGTFTDARIGVSVMRILIELFSQKKNSTVTELPRSQIILDSILHYINMRITENESISINQMCQELFISTSYASHLFKKAVGQSLMQYINLLRISRVKKLLLSTDKKINEISDMLNYPNSSSFCKTFKKYAGYSPNDYRTQYRAQNSERLT